MLSLAVLANNLPLALAILWCLANAAMFSLPLAYAALQPGAEPPAPAPAAAPAADGGAAGVAGASAEAGPSATDPPGGDGGLSGPGTPPGGALAAYVVACLALRAGGMRGGGRVRRPGPRLGRHAGANRSPSACRSVCSDLMQYSAGARMTDTLHGAPCSFAGRHHWR